MSKKVDFLVHRCTNTSSNKGTFSDTSSEGSSKAMSLYLQFPDDVDDSASSVYSKSSGFVSSPHSRTFSSSSQTLSPER